VDPKIFQAALPETYRDLFLIDGTETPVLLPLQEVLGNLPETALRMRTDQHEEEAVDYFETPFSIHAEQDEQRFRGSSQAGLKPSEVPTKQTDKTAAVTAKPDSTATEKVEPAPAPTVTVSEAEKPVQVEAKEPTKVEKEEKNEAKEFVTRASSLPGVAACSITFADGLSLAGNLPAEAAADGLCAMAPSLLQKIDKHMLETKLGPLTAVTLHCAKSPLTFFMQGNICLTVLHTDRQLKHTTQEKLAEMVKELSQVYAQPETAHVDH
jgi:predicted regulator of Ras-like GTPase activity (Roadblock/LC7/MglB family)